MSSVSRRSRLPLALQRPWERISSVLRSNALWLQSSKFVIAGLSLLTGALLGHSLGAGGLGAYGLLLAIAVIVQMVVSLGLDDVVLAWGPRHGIDRRSTSNVLALFLHTRLVTLAVLCCVAIALWLMYPTIGYLSGAGVAWALVYAGANGIATLGCNVFAAQGRARVAGGLDTVWALSTFIAVGSCSLTGVLTVDLCLLITAVCQLFVSAAYVILWHPKWYWFTSFDRRSVVSDLAELNAPDDRSKSLSVARSVILFWANGLLNFGAGKNCDVLVLGVIGASVTDIGYYNAAFAIYVMVATLPMQGIGTILYVRLGRAYSRGKLSEISGCWRMTVVVSFLVILPFLCFAIYWRDSLVSVFYGSELTGAAAPLLVLCVCAVFARLWGGGSNQALLLLANRQGLVLQIRVFLVALNILLVIILYLLFGVIGAAFATGIANISISVVEYLVQRKRWSLIVPFRSFVVYLCCVSTAGLAIFSITGGRASVLMLGLSWFVYLVASGVIVLLVRPLSAEDSRLMVDSVGLDERLARLLRSRSSSVEG